VFDPQTGRLIQVEPEKRPEDLQKPAQRTTAEPPRQPGYDWENVPEYEVSQRVIEIDVPSLRAGDPRYNIVIHNRDVINVPYDTGIYYLMGEVARPGAFSFNGREITLTQAVAAAGGLGRLAWPQRVEIIRRERNSDRLLTIPVNLDAIFARLEPDVLLDDDDVVNFGTNIISPFLFVIRNSFRFTYGFGFVYDRNFADKDSYTVRNNPETLHQLRRQQLGLPF
jgi:polysaccharide biosynthesis/export protein